jgi:hypothetical protein
LVIVADDAVTVENVDAPFGTPDLTPRMRSVLGRDSQEPDILGRNENCATANYMPLGAASARTVGGVLACRSVRAYDVNDRCATAASRCGYPTSGPLSVRLT